VLVRVVFLELPDNCCVGLGVTVPKREFLTLRSFLVEGRTRIQGFQTIASSLEESLNLILVINTYI